MRRDYWPRMTYLEGYWQPVRSAILDTAGLLVIASRWLGGSVNGWCCCILTRQMSARIDSNHAVWNPNSITSTSPYNARDKTRKVQDIAELVASPWQARDISETSLKARTERRIWTELRNWSDQWASRASPLVIGWYIRECDHVGYRRR